MEHQLFLGILASHFWNNLVHTVYVDDVIISCFTYCFFYERFAVDLQLRLPIKLKDPKRIVPSSFHYPDVVAKLSLMFRKDASHASLVPNVKYFHARQLRRLGLLSDL